MLELIEKKASGEEIAVQPEAPEPAKVPDLMAALEASLAAVKDARGEQEEASGSASKKAPPRSSRRRSQQRSKREGLGRPGS